MIITKDNLSTLSTRQLLEALREIRAVVSLQTKWGLFTTSSELEDEHISVNVQHLAGDPRDVSIKDLKEELAKREHVPNKQESIELRKAKNLRGRQKGRCDR